MIVIQQVTKNFDDFTALAGVSLHVNKGSIYGLVGTNGSGKTTLLKTILGVWRPDAGTITIEDQPVFDNEAVKSRIGYIPDDLYFFNSYTLKDCAAYYKGLYPLWNEERYHQMVQLFSLPETRKLSKFSKGMQKQAAFVLTMSAMPDYLILDEPIDGLDPIVRKLVWKFVVNDVADRQMTVVVSSHNLKELEGICDSVAVLDHGMVILETEFDDTKGKTLEDIVLEAIGGENSVYAELLF